MAPPCHPRTANVRIMLHHAGLILELASPVFPSLFLMLACLGSIARAITGQDTKNRDIVKRCAHMCSRPYSLLVAVTTVAVAV